MTPWHRQRRDREIVARGYINHTMRNQEKVMSINKIIRAWEDPEYRSSLSAAELAALPESPAGAIELTDAELGEVLGAAQSGGSVGCNTKTCVSTRGNSNNPCRNC
jgi:mersacidin/lichenicidin family type 2 lantibiotic